MREESSKQVANESAATPGPRLFVQEAAGAVTTAGLVHGLPMFFVRHRGATTSRSD